MATISDTKFINKFKKNVFPNIEGVPFDKGTLIRKVKLFEQFVKYSEAGKFIDASQAARLETKFLAKHITPNLK